jgi:hypothetical protein
MKITIYELLGLVKNGKAPEKIKYEYSIYELMPERNNYYCKDEMRWFTNEINALGVLNNEVEIIEEPKKIEKLNTNIINANRYDYDKNKEKTISNITADFLSISKVVNELIDEINNLKEK